MCREQSKVNDDRRISKLATLLFHICMCLCIFIKSSFDYSSWYIINNQHQIVPYLNLCFKHNQSPKSVSCSLRISCHWVILWIVLRFNPQTFRLDHWLTFHSESFLLISGKISILSSITQKMNIYTAQCESKSSAQGWNFPTGSLSAWRNAQEKKEKKTQVHRRAN